MKRSENSYIREPGEEPADGRRESRREIRRESAGLPAGDGRRCPADDRRGVTLVELLVAIVILGVVSVIFYQGFIVGARTNARARAQHQGTSLAQNILEGLKAEKAGAILRQFAVPVSVDSSGNVTVNFNILPAQLLPSGLNENVGALGDYLTGAEGADGYVRTGDGKYYLYLRGVRMENKRYDALVTLDSAPYRSDLAGGAPAASGQDYNSRGMVRIPQMDATFDAIVANCKEYDEDGFSAVERMAGSSFNEASLYRTITVKIEDTPLLNGNINSRVTAEYEYFFTSDFKQSYPDLIFDNIGEQENVLRNIFLFYQPAYDWGGDTIKIDNQTGREIELYLIKQQTLSDLTRLEDKERGYRMTLEVKGPEGSAVSPLLVRTNLDWNLATGRPCVIPQADCEYNGFPLLSDADKDTILGWNGLDNTQAMDKLMDVTVEVFHAGGSDGVPVGVADFLAGTGEKVAELTGSIRN